MHQNQHKMKVPCSCSKVEKIRRYWSHAWEINLLQQEWKEEKQEQVEQVNNKNIQIKSAIEAMYILYKRV